MNQDEILRAMEICAEGDFSQCGDCPITVKPGCIRELLVEARKLILSMLEKKKAGDMENQEPEPWTRQRVLKEAERCVFGHREHDYGTPEDSFNIIADLWAGYLQGCGVSIDFLESHDVAIMMALLKIARISKNPQHIDNWVDLAGYASCGGEIAWKESQE